MIAIVVFYIHVLGGMYAFTSSYCRHKLADAFMAVAFVAIIFSVGWTIAGFIVRFIVPDGGLGPLLDSDTISLLIVTALEALLYTTYFRSERMKTKRTAATAAGN
jgi:hypothetical protein